MGFFCKPVKGFQCYQYVCLCVFVCLFVICLLALLGCFKLVSILAGANNFQNRGAWLYAVGPATPYIFIVFFTYR